MYIYFVPCLILFVIMCVNFVMKRKYAKLKRDLDFFEKSCLKILPVFGAVLMLTGNNNEVVSDPDAAQLILRSNLEKDQIMTIPFRLYIGNGIVSAPVSTWRPRRKVLVPTFNAKSLNEMVKQVFIRNSQCLADNLRSKAGKGPFPMGKYLTAYTMDSVCESILGVHLACFKNPDQPILKANDEVMRLILQRVLKPWLHSAFLYRLTPQYRQMRFYSKVVHDYIKGIIEKKRKEMEAKHYEDKTTFKSFLEQLLESSVYSDEELMEEALVLMLAGTETTAVIVGFAMIMLSRHPDVQEKVYKELQEVFGNSDRPLDVEDIKRLAYLELVIKETMRLYPVVPVIARKITEELRLPSGATLVPGCGVLVNIWAMHRYQAYWGLDADLFRPERFLETTLAHPAQYMPFSQGPRSCPGFQYAMLSLKVTLATLLRQYRVLPLDGDTATKPLRLTIEIIMKDADDFVVSLESRK